MALDFTSKRVLLPFFLWQQHGLCLHGAGNFLFCRSVRPLPEHLGFHGRKIAHIPVSQFQEQMDACHVLPLRETDEVPLRVTRVEHGDKGGQTLIRIALSVVAVGEKV